MYLCATLILKLCLGNCILFFCKKGRKKKGYEKKKKNDRKGEGGKKKARVTCSFKDVCLICF